MVHLIQLMSHIEPIKFYGSKCTIWFFLMRTNSVIFCRRKKSVIHCFYTGLCILLNFFSCLQLGTYKKHLNLRIATLYIRINMLSSDFVTSGIELKLMNSVWAIKVLIKYNSKLHLYILGILNLQLRSRILKTFMFRTSNSTSRNRT